MSDPAQMIPFTKASACGNDFLIVEASGFPGEYALVSRRMCDRHNGIGADGVEWLFPDSEADVSARLFNSDGSEAEVSGNGTRCVAAYLAAQMKRAQIVIRTGAGAKHCRFVGQDGLTFEFDADMGEPLVGERLSIETMWVRALGTKVSMGNPHFVIFVDRFQEGWQRQAALIATQPAFPNGTNVEYVTVRNGGEIEIRLFERGAGETQSSGTGSCAAAVAAIASGRAMSPVKVIAPGGSQTVRWERRVFLQGSATLICRGEFFI